MQTFLIRIALLAVLSVYPVLANAQISMDAAQALLNKSGGSSQLGDMARHVKMGIDSSPLINQIPAVTAQQMRHAADDVYAVNKLLPTIQRVIASKLKPHDHSIAMRWYESDSGQLITGMEVTFSASMTDLDATGPAGKIRANSATQPRFLVFGIAPTLF